MRAALWAHHTSSPCTSCHQTAGLLSQLPETFKLQKPQSHQIHPPTQCRNPQALPPRLARPDLMWVRSTRCSMSSARRHLKVPVMLPIQKCLAESIRALIAPAQRRHRAQRKDCSFTRKHPNKSRRQLLCSIIGQNKLMAGKMDSCGLKRPKEC